jgi:SET domain
MLARKEQALTYDGGANRPLGYTVVELMHAMWLVRSRAFTTLKKAITLDMTEGLLQRTVMIPFFDLLNHKRSCNAKIEVMETNKYDASLYALVAGRNIQKGEEITICYGTGEEPSWELYCKYGFWPEGHGENDQSHISEVVEPGCWTTTLDQDLTVLKKLSGGDSINRSILDFRVRLKKAERTIL